MRHDPVEPALLRSLHSAAAYPRDPSARRGVGFVQTHLSWVFLTHQRVYKLRKDVDLGFVRFLSRRARDLDCAREVRLNRRLAPSVYLGIAPVLPRGSGFVVGPLREDPASSGAEGDETCVVMRRLPSGGDALSLLETRRLRPVHLDRVAETLARFHARHRLRIDADDTEPRVRRMIDPVRDNFRALADQDPPRVPRATLCRARDRARAFERGGRARLARRIRAGRLVDGHGDLHLAHVWFEAEDAAPLIIDCLEFSEALRRTDAACDVAFLAMDLHYRHRGRLAERFLRRYARESDDFDLYSVVDYFMSYRAAVRAKVAAITAADRSIGRVQRVGASGSARRHLSLAARFLGRGGGGALVLVCGVVGTGKTSAAEIVADEVNGVVISSDRVRKRLAGLGAEERSGSPVDRGIYTRTRTEATYRGLLSRADPVVGSGRVAVLDATYSRTRHRRAALEWARRRRAPALLVEVTCAPEVAVARLRRREALARDPSEARAGFYPESARRFEPIDEWPRAGRFRIRSDVRGWRGELRRRARRWRSG